MNAKYEFWYCDDCHAKNHVHDRSCQFCDTHEHSTTASDYNDIDGLQKCSVCGEQY